MSDLTGNHAKLLEVNTRHYLSLKRVYGMYLEEGNGLMSAQKKSEMDKCEEWIIYHLTKLKFLERELEGLDITWPTKMENDKYNDLLG